MNKTRLFIHCILTCKYRKDLLSIYGKDIKNFLFLMDKKFEIKEMEVDQNHIHLMILYPPTLSVSSIIRKIKQESTIFIWKSYYNALRREFWKENTFWTDGYWVSSIGDAYIDKIKFYIQNQGKG